MLCPVDGRVDGQVVPACLLEVCCRIAWPAQGHSVGLACAVCFTGEFKVNGLLYVTEAGVTVVD